MESHDIEIRYKLSTKQGKDFISSSETPELVAEKWCRKMAEKQPSEGWHFIKGTFSGEARTRDGEFWAIFRYAD